MAMRHLIKTRTYRERAQPGAREHMGLLEKHKDYVLRAKDYHRKEDTLKKMQEKAYFRNPDEYYMKMAHTRTEDGVHRKAEKEQHTHDELKAFKREDAGYLMVKQTAEAKKIERLRANLHMLDAPLQNKHTIFVEDAAAGKALDASRHGATPGEAALAPPVRAKKGLKRRKREAMEAAAMEVADDDDDDDDDDDATPAASSAYERVPKHRREKLERSKAAQYAELEQRQERHAKMGKALVRIGIEKALMGKGARRKLASKGEGAPKAFKWKPRRTK